MLNSVHHTYVGEHLQNSLGLEACRAVPDGTLYSKPSSINTTSQLFVHIPAIFMGLHLVYEVFMF